jgi:hypothetical protein
MTKRLEKLKADLYQWAKERNACKEELQRLKRADTPDALEYVITRNFWWIGERLEADGVTPPARHSTPIRQLLDGTIYFIQMPADEERRRRCRCDSCSRRSRNRRVIM